MPNTSVSSTEAALRELQTVWMDAWRRTDPATLDVGA
jgi:hypothetical protein